MILYEFKCEDHGNFDKFAKLGVKEAACPECGATCGKVITPPRFILDGTDPAYPTAWDRWAKDHERSAARDNAKVREHGEDW